MKNTMIVVANLGSFKAFKFDGDQKSSTPSMEPVEATNPPNEHSKRSNTLTVMEGKSASTPGNQSISATASDGEQHNMELEKRRRAIKQISKNVTQLLDASPDLRCLLAAPKEILSQVLDSLGGSIRERVQKALPLDLTGAPKSELLQHFYPNGTRKAA